MCSWSQPTKSRVPLKSVSTIIVTRIVTIVPTKRVFL